MKFLKRSFCVELVAESVDIGAIELQPYTRMVTWQPDSPDFSKLFVTTINVWFDFIAAEKVVPFKWGML